MCTVSWRNRTNTHSFGATRHMEGVSSAGDCLDHCTTKTTCVAVDIDYKYLPVHCWVYDDPSKLYYTAPLFNVVQYLVVSRQCRTRQQGLCTVSRTGLHPLRSPVISVLFWRTEMTKDRSDHTIGVDPARVRGSGPSWHFASEGPPLFGPSQNVWSTVMKHSEHNLCQYYFQC